MLDNKFCRRWGCHGILDKTGLMASEERWVSFWSKGDQLSWWDMLMPKLKQMLNTRCGVRSTKMEVVMYTNDDIW